MLQKDLYTLSYKSNFIFASHKSCPAEELFEKLKENMKELYNNKELVIRAIETEKAENIINETLDNMKIGQKLYIANKTDPDNYTEILKKDETNYEFKNIGDKAITFLISL